MALPRTSIAGHWNFWLVALFFGLQHMRQGSRATNCITLVRKDGGVEIDSWLVSVNGPGSLESPCWSLAEAILEV